MKPQYEPKTLEQKVAYLVEECGEVLAAVGKMQRWGTASINPELKHGDPGFGETNAEWVIREMVDLFGAINRLRPTLYQEVRKNFDAAMARAAEKGK